MATIYIYNLADIEPDNDDMVGVEPVAEFTGDDNAACEEYFNSEFNSIDFCASYLEPR